LREVRTISSARTRSRCCLTSSVTSRRLLRSHHA